MAQNLHIQGNILEAQAFREINFLYRLSQALTESLDIDIIIAKVISLLREHFNFYYVQVFLLESNPVSKTEPLQLFLYCGSGSIGDRLRSQEYAVNLGDGVVGHVALTNHPFVSNDLQTVPFHIPHPELPLSTAELAVPLLSGGKLLGVLDIHHQAPHQFIDRDMQLMMTITDQLTIALEKSILYTDLQATLLQEQAARTQLVQSEKLAALGRIVASVAHELNNPLQAIQNALYLLKTEESLSNQAREDLQVALTEADRMAGLIARLRETYRPTSSDEFQPHSLNIIVHEVQRLLATHLRHTNVKLTFFPEPELPPCPVIPDQIKQVILNISLNAIESMPNGGEIVIETHSIPDANNPSQILLQFRDTGPGIPDDVLPYIFDPFVTTKDKGTGLGLAITYDIVRRHGGQIEVSKGDKEGTCFRVLLPTQKPEPLEDAGRSIPYKGKAFRTHRA